eukprot:UN25923
MDAEQRAFVEELDDDEEQVLAPGLLHGGGAEETAKGSDDNKNHGMSQGQLVRIWKKLDKDGNGLLDKKELQNLLKKFLTLADDYFEHEKISTRRI